jgi:hypothetical protein
MIHFILQADYVGSERALLYYYFSIFGILNLVAYHPDFGIM